MAASGVSSRPDAFALGQAKPDVYLMVRALSSRRGCVLNFMLFCGSSVVECSPPHTKACGFSSCLCSTVMTRHFCRRSNYNCADMPEGCHSMEAELVFKAVALNLFRVVNRIDLTMTWGLEIVSCPSEAAHRSLKPQIRISVGFRNGL